MEEQVRRLLEDRASEFRMSAQAPTGVLWRARIRMVLTGTLLGALLVSVGAGVFYGAAPLTGGTPEIPPAEDVTTIPDEARMPGEILFAAFDESDSTDSALYTMKPDGTNRTIILEGSRFGHQPERPAWSPDRSKVAFNVYLPSSDGDFDFLNSEIFVINANGTERQRLTNDSEPVVAPVWSPDGTRVVFARADDERSWELWAMNADGSDRELLTDGSTAGDAAWSPDGRLIAFSQFLYRKGERDPYNQELFVMDIASGAVTRFTDTPARESSPAWSPEGSRIAFVSEADGKDSGIHVMNANGSAPTELVPQGVSSVPGLAWSPDGSRIAFVKTNRWLNSPSDQDQDQIAVVSAEGGALQPIGSGHHLILGIDWR